MNFKPNQGYSLRFFSTGNLSDDLVDPQGEEIITTFPAIMINHVFEEIEEGFVIIKECLPPFPIPCFPNEFVVDYP